MKTCSRLGIFCAVSILLTCGSNQGYASEPSQPITFFDYAGEDLRNLPSHVLEDSKKTFSKPDNMTLLLLAGGASIAMNQGPDKTLEDTFEKNEIFHGYADSGLNLFGGPGFHFAAAGLWYALSVENDDEFNRERAWTLIRALSVTGFTTLTLKAIRNDETPVGDDWAWPSGHTSSSFALASVLDEFYGPNVGIPAYIFASLVGLRMMDQGDHWGSDVVFGAALGWVAGHTIAGEHKELELAGFKVAPFTAVTAKNRSVIGINLYKQF